MARAREIADAVKTSATVSLDEAALVLHHATGAGLRECLAAVHRLAGRAERLVEQGESVRLDPQVETLIDWWCSSTGRERPRAARDLTKLRASARAMLKRDTFNVACALVSGLGLSTYHRSNGYLDLRYAGRESNRSTFLALASGSGTVAASTDKLAQAKEAAALDDGLEWTRVSMALFTDDERERSTSIDDLAIALGRVADEAFSVLVSSGLSDERRKFFRRKLDSAKQLAKEAHARRERIRDAVAAGGVET